MNSILVVEANTFEFYLTVCQSQDPKIKELKARLLKEQDNLYEIRNGLVYRKVKDKLLFYVPQDMERELLYKYHNEFGHFGVETYEVLRESYWFPEMRSKIQRHIRNCVKCIAFTIPSGKVEGFIHGIPKGEKPFDTIHVDHFGVVNRVKATKKYVFLIVDAFTKCVKLYAVKTTTTRETIKCLREYFNAYSRPKIG